MFKNALLASALVAGSMMATGSAMAVAIIGSAGGSFDNVSSCGGGNCGIFDTVTHGDDTQLRWGSTSSSTNLVNPSTLTSFDVTINANTNASIRIGQLQWFNNATRADQTDDNFSVDWDYSVTFTSPGGSADPNGSETFVLNITNPTNPPGDLISGFTLADLDPGIILSLNGVTISNFRYEIEDLGGDSGASGCSGADTSFSGNTWRNCEGNTANLYIVADFTAPTSVPEPMTLGLLGAGLLGLGYTARRRRNA